MVDSCALLIATELCLFDVERLTVTASFRRIAHFASQNESVAQYAERSGRV